MLRLIFVAALAAGLPFQPSSLDPRSGKKISDLRFREDGTFQITVFSDFHLGELSAVPDGPAQDAKTLQVMREVLDYEKPDFVVLNGDLVTGESAPRRKNAHYIDHLVKPLVERNLTWGSTYGEHDHTFTLHGGSLLRHERRFAGSRTRKMVNLYHAGTSNYYVPVYAADCVDVKRQKCHPELLLWFFDSRGGYDLGRSTRYGNPAPLPNWVDASVVRWFQKTNQKLSRAAQRDIPALAFVHIPITAAAALQKDGLDPHKNPGIDHDVPVSHQGMRWCNERKYDLGGLRCDKDGLDTQFMTALATTPGLRGLFFGHDHGNTWCSKWQSRIPGTDVTAKGINLCYGQHTGYGGYGNWIRGGRQIVVNRQSEDLGIQTHIRLEDGRIVGAVNLNSTLNEDSYPATPNDETFLKLS
ncbi:hypothetical protein E4U35_001335 [Claviceps purpurea]|nr:hypothetical protein E4U11_007792 [Claviceps purpurea]KAG6206936.1 hypothetical protein E4U35_001335 [Claviceps purpurea]KAG6306490.1 hypothetical protein E4U45_007061 [Claviceps purpurea]